MDAQHDKLYKYAAQRRELDGWDKNQSISFAPFLPAASPRLSPHSQHTCATSSKFTVEAADPIQHAAASTSTASTAVVVLMV
jgi:hypothetical protein